MSPQRRLIGFGVVGAVLVILAAVGILIVGRASTASNERLASAVMKSFSSVEVSFKTTDPAESGVNSYWVRDVAGLYYITPTGKAPIHMIELATCGADGHNEPSLYAAPAEPHRSAPNSGYWFQTLTYFEAGDGTSNPIRRYDQNNTDRFGIIAYPNEYGVTGRRAFVLSEDGTLWRRDFGRNAFLSAPLIGAPEAKAKLENSYDIFPFDPDVPAPEPIDTQAQAPPTVPELHASDLKNTFVTAYLQRRHERGQNLLWCGTFQMAWNEMRDFLGGGPVILERESEIAAALNERLTSKGDLDEASYVARAGRTGVVKQISTELERKFGKVPEMMSDLREPRPDEILAFAYLFKSLAFERPFKKRSLTFMGRNVKAFGSSGKDERVRILHYQSKDEFAVELITKQTDDRVILARLDSTTTLRETIEQTLKLGAQPGQAMELGDTFVVPEVRFDVDRKYSELIGQRLRKGGLLITGAFQRIRFDLNEKGVILESMGTWSLMNGHEPRRIIFDGPFLVLVLRRGPAMPYFALWIENPALLTVH